MAVQRQAVYLLELEVDSVGQKVHEPRHKKKRQAECEGRTMKELKKKLFWSGIESKAFIFIVIINAVNSGTCVARGDFVFATFTAFFAVMFIYAGVQMSQYHQFLKKACENPESEHVRSASHISRIKLSFETFLPMYLANKEPWVSTEKRLFYHKSKLDNERWTVWYDEYFTIVYFDYKDYLKYKSWVKERERLEEEAAVKKSEAEFTERELKLNLQFIDSVTEDVKKMKASAEEEMQKAAEELKKAAQQK